MKQTNSCSAANRLRRSPISLLYTSRSHNRLWLLMWVVLDKYRQIRLTTETNLSSYRLIFLLGGLIGLLREENRRWQEKRTRQEKKVQTIPEQNRPNQTRTGKEERTEQTRPEENRTEQTWTDQNRPDQGRPDNADQIRTDHTRPDQTRPDQARTKQNRTDWNRPAKVIWGIDEEQEYVE